MFQYVVVAGVADVYLYAVALRGRLVFRVLVYHHQPVFVFSDERFRNLLS